MDTDSAIERFVIHLQESGINTRILSNAPWIKVAEKRLGVGFPPSFRSLVVRYAFPVLDIGEVELFANEGDGSDYDITFAPFRHPYMSPWLSRHKLIHIGHPFFGNYDPVCFDLMNKK